MVESIVAGLVLAAVSAVTFLAYKHPRGFARLFGPAALLATAIAAGLSVWQMLNIVSSASVIQHLVAELPKQPLSSIADEAAKLTASLWHLGWVVGIYGGVMVYLLFLRQLPRIVGGEASDKRLQATRETRAPEA